MITIYFDLDLKGIIMQTKKKILIADANAVSRSILVDIFREQYVVLETEDGEDAIRIMRKEGDVSVVLFDLELPKIDGFTFLKEIRKFPELLNIPVIITSEKSNKKHEMDALSLGASDFLARPEHLDVVKHKVHALIRLNSAYEILNTMEYDLTTGLHTREYLYASIKETLLSDKGQNYDVVFGDIMGFKVLSDIFGEEVSEDIIKIAGTAQRDMFGDDVLTCRYGEDTFMTFLPHREAYPIEDFVELNKKLTSLMPYANVAMKFGIYQNVDRRRSPRTICDRAILAQKTIKSLYDHYVTFYDQNIREKYLEERNLIEGMKSAIEEKQLKVYLQPKYHMKNNRILGAEALVRWEHPEKGLLSPGAFVPIFERHGYIEQMDFYVWEEACAIYKEMKDEGICVVPISVNVSRVELNNTKLPEILLGLTRKYDMIPSELHLEITESAYIDNQKVINEAIRNLKNAGFMIEMDDFGTGYSSLNMLSEMPINVLKIDMRFIQTSSNTDTSKSIMGFVISLGKWIHVDVIVEGVETKEQIDMLKEMDCNYVQGYYYAKPMPKDEFKALLIENNKKYLNSSCEVIKDRGEPASIFTTVTKNQENKKILLIVDDMEVNRAAIRKVFAPYYTIAEASNGEAALLFMKKHVKNIEILLLDLFMPVMDGFQLMNELSEDSKLQDIPIIITSEAGDNSEVRAYQMGAQDYITKPFVPDVLLFRVKNVVDAAVYRRKQKEIERKKELIEEAYKDFMTNTLNRRGLTKVWEDLPETCNGLFALFVIDVDDFKKYNDESGHMQGDQILIRFVNNLRAILRSDDIIARVGGDEFVAIITNMHSKEAVEGKAQIICEKIGVPISLGGVCFTERPDDIHKISSKAEELMYEVKRTQKGGFQIFQKN